MWSQLDTIAQAAIGRILDSLPEGLLIALFAGVMLRILPRQNSGTRFAVWFVALLAVAGIPVAGLAVTGRALGGHSVSSAGAVRPLITLPGACGLVLFLAWITAACFAMLRLTMGLLRLRQLRQSCVAINGTELAPAIQKAITDFSSTGSVNLVTCERVRVPAVIGFFKPMIVLPAWSLRELLPEELHVILLHEFAHVRRWDAWTNLLQKIVRAVFLFHPAVWWIDRQLSLEREMACDDQVLAATANPRGYAKCLIVLLEKSVARRGWAMAHAVVHRAHEASLRLAQILDDGRPNTKNVWKPAMGLVAAFSTLCLVVVPHAPQFVAFERNTRTTQAVESRSALIGQSPVSVAAVIPAAMGMGSSSVRRVSQQPPATVAAHPLAHRHAGPQVIAARWSPNTEHKPVRTVTLGTIQTVLAASETLLIIQTTHRVGPDSWVWSVCVWRMTVVKPTQDAAGTEPALRKT